jgi:hypothetical protein
MTVHGYPPDAIIVFIKKRPSRPLPSILRMDVDDDRVPEHHADGRVRLFPQQVEERRHGFSKPTVTLGANRSRYHVPWSASGAVFLQASCFYYPIVLRCIYAIALYGYYPVTYLNRIERGLVPPAWECGPAPRCRQANLAVSS